MEETDPKYFNSVVVEALYPEDSEYYTFQLGRDSDYSKEPPGKVVGKDDHSKTRKCGEEVIQDARNLEDLEQVIK